MTGRIWMMLAVVMLAAVVVDAQAPAKKPEAKITVDKDARSISIPCAVAPRKLDYLKEIYPIEVIACWPHPDGKKAHETVVVFTVKPSDVHKALESIGLKAGNPAVVGQKPASGDEVKVLLEVPGPDGQPRRVPIEKTLVDKKTGKPMPTVKWLFTGSVLSQLSPDKPDKTYGADLTGTLVTVFPVTDQCVIQTNLSMDDEPLLKMETNKKLLPAEGEPVTLIIQAK